MRKPNTQVYSILLAIIIYTFLTGCAGKDGKNNLKTEDTIKADLKNVKEIIFSVPSPIETAFLIKSSGVTFDPKVLNAPDKVSKYLTSQDKAVNLGVYSVDLCFVSLNNQSQLLLNYVANIKILTDELGILDGIDKSVMDEIEKKVNDKAFVMNTISDKVLKNTSLLSEDRKLSAAYILFGAYIEGLYILTQHGSKTATPDEELIRTIVGQKLTLENIKNLINQFDKDKVKAIVDDLNGIYLKLQTLPDTFTETVTVYDSVKKEMVIKSQNKTQIKPSTIALKELFFTVQQVRNSYTK